MVEISRRQFAFYAVVVVVVVLLGGRALRADAGSAVLPPVAGVGQAEPGTSMPAGADGPAAAGTTGASGSTGTAAPVEPGAGGGEGVLVHVAGRVREPGVYELRAGSRVADALRRAGGGRPGADLDALNLAAKITDGQQVLVARRGATVPRGPAAASAGAPTSQSVVPPAAGGAAAGGGAEGAPVDVNAATAVELEVLNGVGPAIAAKIVDWRTQNGPFRTVEDLAQVPGIGPKKLEAMRAQVRT